jgi:outer membrane murein-binding lipoprotein Lpp
MKSEVKLAFVAAAALVLAGCASSRVDANWGEGLGHTWSAQIDPNNSSEIVGLDAQTAELVADRYYKGQQTQQTRQPPIVVMGTQ